MPPSVASRAFHDSGFVRDVLSTAPSTKDGPSPRTEEMHNFIHSFFVRRIFTKNKASVGRGRLSKDIVHEAYTIAVKKLVAHDQKQRNKFLQEVRLNDYCACRTDAYEHCCHAEQSNVSAACAIQSKVANQFPSPINPVSAEPKG